MQTNQIINTLGGTAKVASLCQVTPGAVSQWKKHGIPRGHLNFLMLYHMTGLDHPHWQKHNLPNPPSLI